MTDIFKNIVDDTDEEDETFSSPIDDPESECYGCEAGMCSICRGDNYDNMKDIDAYYYDFD